jgi:hypothetical protein
MNLEIMASLESKARGLTMEQRRQLYALITGEQRSANKTVLQSLAALGLVTITGAVASPTEGGRYVAAVLTQRT